LLDQGLDQHGCRSLDGADFAALALARPRQ
jgi:hypothetical protein